MQAWKRRVVTYQLVNVTAMVLLTVGASRAILGQINPVEPVAPPRPECTQPGITRNSYDFAVQAFSVEEREAKVIADGMRANSFRLLLRPGASDDAARAAAVAQAEKLLKPHDALLLNLSHAGQGTWLPPRITSFVGKYPALSAFVAAGRLMLLKGDVARARGKADEAAEAYGRALLWGERIGQGANFWGSAPSSFLMRQAREGLASVADRVSLPVAQNLARVFANERDAEQPLWDTLREEQYTGQMGRMEIFRDPGVLDRLYPRQNPKLSRYAPVLYTLCSKQETLAAYTRYMEDEIQRAHLPYRSSERTVPLPGDLLNRLLLPANPPTRFQATADQVQLRLVGVRLALRAHRLRFGRYPETLGELKGHELSRLPTDGFATWRDPRADFGYRRAGSGYVLYSVGPDGRDEGGRVRVKGELRPDRIGDVVVTGSL